VRAQSLDRLNRSMSGDELPFSDRTGLRRDLQAERNEHQHRWNTPQQVTFHLNLRYMSLSPDGQSCVPTPTCGVWECEDDRQANTCCPDKVEDTLVFCVVHERIRTHFLRRATLRSQDPGRTGIPTRREAYSALLTDGGDCPRYPLRSDLTRSAR
jgi:hypothetical protein